MDTTQLGNTDGPSRVCLGTDNVGTHLRLTADQRAELDQAGLNESNGEEPRP